MPAREGGRKGNVTGSAVLPLLENSSCLRLAEVSYFACLAVNSSTARLKRSGSSQ
jgi:hypothetical protein